MYIYTYNTLMTYIRISPRLMLIHVLHQQKRVLDVKCKRYLEVPILVHTRVPNSYSYLQ